MSIVPPTAVLRKLYEGVSAHDIEYASVAFWSGMLQTEFNVRDGRHISVPEYSPDQSKTRADFFVLSYDAQHHTITKGLLVEAKRPGANPKEAEQQATQYAAAVIRHGNLDSMYAITTWGTRFRTWRYFNIHNTKKVAVQALDGKGESGYKNAYIDADSSEGYLFTTICDMMKETPALGIAPLLPSQSLPAFDTQQSTGFPNDDWYAAESSQAEAAYPATYDEMDTTYAGEFSQAQAYPQNYNTDEMNTGYGGPEATGSARAKKKMFGRK